LLKNRKVKKMRGFFTFFVKYFENFSFQQETFNDTNNLSAFFKFLIYSFEQQRLYYIFKLLKIAQCLCQRLVKSMINFLRRFSVFSVLSSAALHYQRSKQAVSSVYI